MTIDMIWLTHMGMHNRQTKTKKEQQWHHKTLHFTNIHHAQESEFSQSDVYAHYMYMYMYKYKYMYTHYYQGLILVYKPLLLHYFVAMIKIDFYNKWSLFSYIAGHNWPYYPWPSGPFSHSWNLSLFKLLSHAYINHSVILHLCAGSYPSDSWALIGFLPQCDVIVVMADGQVTEVGSYNELIENDGAFAQFLQNYQSTEFNKDENGTTLQADFSVFPVLR